jgi:hypothetical protein
MSSFSNIFKINGVIDTTKSVKSNMDILAAAAGSWVTLDIHRGLWSVIVNEPGSSIASFNNDNIIGSITVNGSGLTELYNRVQLQFPHKDLNDQIDTITYEIPSGDRYPYEFDNTLNYQFDCINDPVQAGLLASMQLKQSRIDKVIQFRTDFSKIGIKAGDIIDVTNDIYGYTNKKFRVLSVSEEDGDDHTIQINITAFEYDEGVYSQSGLIRTERTTSNGIQTDCTNTAITASEDAAKKNDLAKLLPLLPLLALLWPWLNEEFFKKKNTPKVALDAPDDICEGETATVNVSVCCSACEDLQGVEVDYEITGVTEDQIDIPLTGTVAVDSGGIGTLVIPTIDDTFDEDVTEMTVKFGDSEAVINVHDHKTYSATASTPTITEGQSTTVIFSTTNVPDGTVVHYEINGSGLGQLSNQPETGQITVNADTAYLTIQTKDIDAYDDTTLIVSLTSEGIYWCQSDFATITILHTGTRPPEPPADTNCEWVSIPAVWCGTFDGTTGAVKSVFPIHSVTVLKAIPGQSKVTVPLTVTLNGNNISVATTVDVDASSGKGGSTWNIITSFNAMTTGVKRVTGSTTQVVGY